MKTMTVRKRMKNSGPKNGLTSRRSLSGSSSSNPIWVMAIKHFDKPLNISSRNLPNRVGVLSCMSSKQIVLIIQTSRSVLTSTCFPESHKACSLCSNTTPLSTCLTTYPKPMWNARENAMNTSAMMMVRLPRFDTANCRDGQHVRIGELQRVTQGQVVNDSTRNILCPCSAPSPSIMSVKHVLSKFRSRR